MSIQDLRERFHGTAHVMRNDEWDYVNALEGENERLRGLLRRVVAETVVNSRWPSATLMTEIEAEVNP